MEQPPPIPTTTPTPSSILSTLVSFGTKSGAAIAATSCLGIALLYVFQEKLLYFPEIGGLPRRPAQNPKYYRSPTEHGLEFENVMVEASDGVRTNGWLLLQKGSSRQSPTVIFFHGNAGNIGLRLPNAKHMYHYLNANIFMAEYRGFGDSEGSPTEVGIRRDSEAVLRYVMNHSLIDPSQVFIFGRSLGGAVGFHLAEYAEENRIPVAGLIVENTFLSISKMIDVLMPYLTPLKSLILKIGWDSEHIAAKLHMPVLYLAGAKDELVPHEQMLELHKLSSVERKGIGGGNSAHAQLHIVKDGRHNETWMQGGREYFDSIRKFISASVKVNKNVSDSDIQRCTDNQVNSAAVPDVLPSMASSSIPLMPKTLTGMAKEASSTSHKQSLLNEKQL